MGSDTEEDMAAHNVLCCRATGVRVEGGAQTVLPPFLCTNNVSLPILFSGDFLQPRTNIK